MFAFLCVVNLTSSIRPCHIVTGIKTTTDGQNHLADAEISAGEMTRRMQAGSTKNAGGLKSVSLQCFASANEYNRKMMDTMNVPIVITTTRTMITIMAIMGLRIGALESMMTGGPDKTLWMMIHRIIKVNIKGKADAWSRARPVSM